MNSVEGFISSVMLEVEKKVKQNEFYDALDILSNLMTKNNKILFFRAKIYFSISDFYNSLKDCEECINLSLNDNSTLIEVYQLSVINYIKMFDLENAKEKLNICFNLEKNNQKNKELFSLIFSVARQNL